MPGSPPTTPADYTLTPTPYTVVVDTREQAPYTFATPLREGRRYYRVETIRGTLHSGDYSLAGFESRVAVERKSLADLYSTLCQGRRRFTDELARLNAMEFAAVVIEADWQTILVYPPKHSQLNPRTVFASVVAWQQRFPRVHWWTANHRTMGEGVTLNVLARFWKERQAEKKGSGS